MFTEKIKEMKRLIVKPVIFPAIADRSFWNGFDDALKQSIVTKGESFLNYEWPLVRATSYLQFSENGNRLATETPSFAKRAALSSLVLAECMENEGRFLRDIIDGIWSICEESTWSVSAHIKLGVLTDKLPDTDEAVFDLFSGETGGLLSVVYYVLQEPLDAVTPIISKRIKSEVTKRLIDSFLGRDDYWWMGTNPNQKLNNWSPWCTSNALLSAAAFCDDNETLNAVVVKSLEILEKFIATYGNDGACDEGPSYWSRAAASLADCLDMLLLVSGGRLNFYNEPLIRKMGEYVVDARLTTRHYLNCADCPMNVVVNPSRLFSYGKNTGSSRMMGEGAFIFRQNNCILPETDRWNGSARNFFNLLSYNELKNCELKPKPQQDVWFEDLQVLVARETTECDKGLVIAVKGGNNDENHNHNDVGNFVVFSDGKPIFIDLGVGTYTAKTFSPGRYSIWTMRSGYHNLPEICDIEQAAGSGCRAKNVACHFDAKSSRVSMDIASAYPEKVLQWVRLAKLDRADGKILINEFFKLAERQTITFNFMSLLRPEICDGFVSLGGHTLAWSGGDLYAEIEEITVDKDDKKLRSALGETVYRTKIITRNELDSGEITFEIKRK